MSWLPQWPRFPNNRTLKHNPFRDKPFLKMLHLPCIDTWIWKHVEIMANVTNKIWACHMHYTILAWKVLWTKQELWFYLYSSALLTILLKHNRIRTDEQKESSFTLQVGRKYGWNHFVFQQFTFQRPRLTLETVIKKYKSFSMATAKNPRRVHWKDLGEQETDAPIIISNYPLVTA